MAKNKPIKKLTKITEAQYVEATELNMGWCTHCKEFIREGTEPDAEEYDCPECEKNTVMGAENALIVGLFEFAEDCEV